MRGSRAGLRLGLVMVGYTQCPRGAFSNFHNNGIVAATLIFGALKAMIKINLCLHRNAVISVLIAGLAITYR